MSTEIDHLIVAADSLQAGAAWCAATLGAAPQPGGKHPLMGTHNLLLDLSSDAYPRCYLEIIAIDPDAPAPGRARWFGLDARAPGPPVLWHAVARSTMLDMHRWGLIQRQADPGLPLAMQRGDLRWQVLVRDDGCPLGALPSLIQWQGAHPTERLPASGAQLLRVTIDGLPAAQREVLRLRAVAGDPAAPPRLALTLRTPQGELSLQSTPGSA